MKTNQHDIELIHKLGGPSKVAELLGLDKQGGAQRVQNWLTRGIPAQVKLDFPDIFMPERGQSLAATEPPAEPAPAHPIPVDEPGALRAGAMRRHGVRRLQDAGVKPDRRDIGPPCQSPEVWVA